jgi:hypothetical protein
MKPLPAPSVPGKTDFQRFDNAVRQVLGVSKEELFRREESEQKIREQNREHRQNRKKIAKVAKKIARE